MSARVLALSQLLAMAKQVSTSLLSLPLSRFADSARAPSSLLLAMTKQLSAPRLPTTDYRLPNSYSFGTGPYLFFLFSPGKKARRMIATMKITAVRRVALSSEPKTPPPS